MPNKYNSLEELRRKKDLLKKEVDELQNILTFDDTKESLSALTGGFTDPYLSEETDAEGEKSVSINKKQIVKAITDQVKDKITNKNSVIGFVKGEVGSSIAENAIKLGIVAFVGNFAKKSLNNASWKKKLIGLAIIYLVPFALRFIRTKLENFEKNRSVSSMEQLI